MMRTLLLLAVLTVAFTQQACTQNSRGATVQGSGKITTQTIEVQPFTTLSVSGAFELRLAQGEREGVRIEADDNLQQYFNVRNEGERLVIDTKGLNNKSLNTKNRMRVYVTFRQLRELDLNTVGATRSEGRLQFTDLLLSNKSVGALNLELKARELTVRNKSVGNVTLSGQVEQAEFVNNSVGSFEAGGLQAQSVYIENSGVGTAEVNAARTLTVSDNWLGKVKNKGAAEARKVSRS